MISAREAAAVHEFLGNDLYGHHAMRDHPQHNGNPILGMWTFCFNYSSQMLRASEISLAQLTQPTKTISI